MGTATNGQIVKAASTGSGGGSSTGLAVLGATKGAPIQGANMVYTDAVIPIPAGTLQVGDFLALDVSLRKASAVDGAVSLWLEFASAVAHAAAASILNGTTVIASTAGHLAGRGLWMAQVTSLTSIETVGLPSANGGGLSSSTGARTVTVPSLDVNALNLFAVVSTPAVNVELEGLVVQVLRPGASISGQALSGAQIVALLDAQLGGATWQSGGGGVSLYGDLVGGTWKAVPSVFRLRMAGTGTVTLDVRNKAGTITAGVQVYAVAGAERIEWQPSWAASDITEIRVTLSGSATAEVI